MRYSHLPRNLSTSSVCYWTNLLPGALLPSLLPRAGILPLLWNTRDMCFPFWISLGLLILKKWRGQKTHVLGSMWEILVPTWYRRRILSPASSRTRTSLWVRTSLSTRTRHHSLPTSKGGGPIREKEHVMFVVILGFGLSTSRTTMIDDSMGRATKSLTLLLVALSWRQSGKFPTVLSVCHSVEWWIDMGANNHVCYGISMFSSY